MSGVGVNLEQAPSWDSDQSPISIATTLQRNGTTGEMTISVPQSSKWKRYSECNLCWLGFHQSFDMLAQHNNKYACMMNISLKKTNLLLRTDHKTQVQRKRAYDDPMLKPPKGKRRSRRWEFLCSSYSLELTCLTSFSLIFSFSVLFECASQSIMRWQYSIANVNYAIFILPTVGL